MTDRAPVWIGFAMMCLGMFMAILDVQVVATSIPTIQTAFGVPADQMSWVQTAYLIAEVIAIPLTGVLTRVLTMRWLFVSAISVFVVASAGCAASSTFAGLIVWRVLQGFSGGTLIPAVFSAVFLLFPPARQGVATTVAGVLAVLAPTIGPVVGGWITETYSWHWLFLINVAPGILAAVLGVRTLPSARLQLGELRRLDSPALVMMSLALAALVLALKQAPHDGWLSLTVTGLLSVSLVSAIGFGVRTWFAKSPIVQLATLTERPFAVGSFLSFVLGFSLFGSVYMMPVFLAVAHDDGALAIGKIMLVTGVAQLLVAPIAVELDKRIDPRWLSGLGFGLFALGLGLSGGQTLATDYDEMFWPQVVRGTAIMFCLLPPTRMALGWLPPDRVADASGLFNLMRNLGGAIGLALIDTIIYGRAPGFGAAIADRLRAGDVAAAKLLDIPLDLFAQHQQGTLDADTEALVKPLIEHYAIVQAMNEAWIVVALITCAAILSLAVAVPPQRPKSSDPAGE